MISTLLILYDTIQQSVANTPTLWDKISTSPIFIILSILGALASIFGVYSICKSALNGTRIWCEQYIKDNILDDELNKHNPQNKPSKTTKSEDDSIQTDSSYDDNIDSNIYIQPYILTPVIEVPDDNATPTFRLKKPFLLRDFFIKKVFVRVRGSNIPKYYYLFGNSGTGKTAALVHLFYDYINQYNKNSLPYNIRIFSLREENVFESIDKVNVDKRGCILLLDALDENPMVQKPKESEEFKLFIKQLDKVYSEFAFVITTCRPQFFSEEKEIPDSHNIAKIELVPFNDDQINEFLDQIFNISNEAEKRSKAINLIDNHHEIAKRPIILTYIRDLVDTDRKLNTSLDFYDTIAESELRRNISRIPQNVTAENIRQWWNMTSEVAGYMYNHGKTEISYEELLQILIDHHLAQPNESINEDLFQRRSLLTRTGNSFHFSHKSFYEYFMAYRFLQHPEEIKQVYGMDFALHIYDEAYKAWSEKKDTPFADLKNTDYYYVAASLNRTGYALDDINHFIKAESYYQEALKILCPQKKNEDNTYGIATTYNNLAELYRKTNEPEKAENGYHEALKRYYQLAKNNPNLFLPCIATTLNNIGIIYYDNKNYQEAEEKYNNALSIHRELSQQGSYDLTNLAITLNNLANLHKVNKQPDKAKEEYVEALTIYQKLYKDNNNVLPDYANTLNNLATLHSDSNQLDKAEEEYNEALSIRRKLADKNPDAFLPDVAATLFNLALLHLNRKEFSAAEAAALESLEKYSIMAEKSHAAFDKDVKDAEELLERIQKAKEADA